MKKTGAKTPYYAYRMQIGLSEEEKAQYFQLRKIFPAIKNHKIFYDFICEFLEWVKQEKKRSSRIKIGSLLMERVQTDSSGSAKSRVVFKEFKNNVIDKARV